MRPSVKKILLSLSLVFLLHLSFPVLAAGDSSLPTIKNPTDNLLVKIPGMKKGTPLQVTEDDSGNQSVSVPWIADYILAWYNYLMAIIGLLALIGIAIGGVNWVVSAGNPGKIRVAKAWITDSLIGIIIAVSSYTILYSINHELVVLKPITINYIEKEDLPGASDYDNFDTSKTFPNAPGNIFTATIDTTSGSKNIQIDQRLKDDAIQIFQELKSIGFPVTAVSGYRPGSAYCHGRGLAIDVNPNQNYCVDCYKHKGAKVGSFFQPGVDSRSMTEAAVGVFKRHGWCWGGDWKGFKEYMHFSKGCSAGECSQKAPYDWSKSAQENQSSNHITYP